MRTAGALAALAVAAVACGATTSIRGPVASAAAPLPLASSLVTASGAWAMVPVSGFWQLLYLPSAGARWALATPPGVADEGGLVAGSAPDGTLLVGFRPTASLSFSPLAQTGNGKDWSAGLLPGGLVQSPDAVALGADGGAWAVLRGGGGNVVAASSPGGRWHRVVTTSLLAASSAGRACGLTAIIGAAITGAGTGLLAGACSKPGVVGIFTNAGVHGDGGWALSGPTLADTSGRRIRLLRLATNGRSAFTLLEVPASSSSGATSASRYVAAWSSTGGSTWTQTTLEAPGSSEYAGGAPASALQPTASASGGAGPLTFEPSSAFVIFRLQNGALDANLLTPAGSEALPTLPPGTGTLAAGRSGVPQAVSVQGRFVDIWSLIGRGTGHPEWRMVQAVYVPAGGT